MAIGRIQVHAFASRAQIPLRDVAVAIVGTDGSVISLGLTNRNGLLDAPVEVAVPEASASQSPDTGIVPYTRVNIYARLENFEQIEANDVQVFPGITTLQELEMVPLSELPDLWNQSEIYNTPSQNL